MLERQPIDTGTANEPSDREVSALGTLGEQALKALNKYGMGIPATVLLYVPVIADFIAHRVQTDCTVEECLDRAKAELEAHPIDLS